MDTATALIFSCHMFAAYCIVLWIQHSAWKEFKEYKQNTEKAILDLTAEINSLKKNYPGGEPKKILIDQKILYGLK